MIQEIIFDIQRLLYSKASLLFLPRFEGLGKNHQILLKTSYASLIARYYFCLALNIIELYHTFRKISTKNIN